MGVPQSEEVFSQNVGATEYPYLPLKRIGTSRPSRRRCVGFVISVMPPHKRLAQKNPVVLSRARLIALLLGGCWYHHERPPRTTAMANSPRLKQHQQEQ